MRLHKVNLNKAGLFESSFFWGGGGGKGSNSLQIFRKNVTYTTIKSLKVKKKTGLHLLSRR